MPRLASCQWVPGPVDHVNQYSGYGATHPKRLVVLHSSMGYWNDANGPVQTMVARGNSWHLSALKDGSRLQHYDTDAICWHAGSAGNIVANIHGIGIELEGLHEDSDGSGQNDRLTSPQIVSLQIILKEIWKQYEWDKPAKGINLYEHRMFGTSACPTTRWDDYGYWNDLFINFLEDVMTPSQEAKLDRVITLLEMLVAPRRQAFIREWNKAHPDDMVDNVVQSARDVLGRFGDLDKGIP